MRKAMRIIKEYYYFVRDLSCDDRGENRHETGTAFET